MFYPLFSMEQTKDGGVYNIYMPPQNQAPYQPMPPQAPAPHDKKPAGPIVGVIIIVLLLIFGALYFWGAHLNKQSETLPLIPGSTSEY